MDILQSQKKTYHLQLFSGVEHGFALRGDMDNPYEREQVNHSFYGSSELIKETRLCEGAVFEGYNSVVRLLAFAVIWR